MKEPHRITTQCHGCHIGMVFDAVPVTLTTWEGVKTYYGKSEAIWICKSCREIPARLRAARKATGWLEPEAKISEYDETEDGEGSPEVGARTTSGGSEGGLLPDDSRPEGA